MSRRSHPSQFIHFNSTSESVKVFFIFVFRGRAVVKRPRQGGEQTAAAVHNKTPTARVSCNSTT